VLINAIQLSKYSSQDDLVCILLHFQVFNVTLRVVCHRMWP